MNIEIINLIYNYLWYSDINKSRLVCKRWNEAVNNNNYQYKRMVIEQLNSIFLIKKNEVKINFRSKIHPRIYLFFIKLIPDNFFDYTFLQGSNKIIIESDTIYFDGLNEGGDRIVFLNRSIPKGPFILPIKNKNSYNLYLSNVYYFEIKIEQNQFRNGWDNECVSLGFCNRDFNSGCVGYQVGWLKGTFGYHSDDGGIFIESGGHHTQDLDEPWGPGDVVGAGVVYLNKIIKIFFTKNGKFLGFFASKKVYKFRDYNLTPAISVDSSYPIKVNFGHNQFVFPIENMILDYYKSPSQSLIKHNCLHNYNVSMNQIINYDKDNSYKDENQTLEEISSNFLQDLLVQFIMNT